jgi:CHAT domain-containing protein/tetratricopeptide (TPR) repeat protein
LLRSQEETKPFELADARELVESLKLAAGLPKRAQEELAESDRLTSVLGEHLTRGEYTQGVSIGERQLEIRKRLLGDTRPEVGESLTNLAVLLRYQGDLKRAEALCRQGLENYHAVYGDEHPQTAAAKFNLGAILREQGRYPEAKSLLREALDIDRRLLGDEDINLAYDHNDLGRLLQLQADYAGAEGHYRRAIAIMRNHKGEDNPEFAGILDNLSSVLASQGDHAQAEPLRRRSLAVRRKILGENHPLVAESLSNLGFVLMRKGNMARAEAYFREALVIFRNLFGEEHFAVAQVAHNLGAVSMGRGDYESAEDQYLASLAIWRKIVGADHPEIATTLRNLARLYERRGDYALAETHYQESLAMYQKLLGSEHPLVALNLNSLAVLCRRRGNYGRAEGLHRQALVMQEGLLGKQHPEVGATLLQMAHLSRDRLDYKSAEELYARAATIFEIARLRSTRGPSKSAYLSSPYPQLAASRLALGATSEAWPPVEKGLGRLLADLLSAAERGALTQAESALQDSLLRTLGGLESQLTAYRKAARSDSSQALKTRILEARNRLLLTEADWGEFQREVASKHPIPGRHAYSLRRVQNALRERTAILGWLDAHEGKGSPVTWGYVIKRTGSVTWVRLGASGAGRDSQGRQTRALREALVAPGGSTLGPVSTAEVTEAAHELWKMRVAPLMGSLEGIEDLIVIPSSGMLGVPVEALVDTEGMYLGDRLRISYAPSATIYASLTEESTKPYNPATRSGLFIGDPPYSEDQLASMEQKEGQNSPENGGQYTAETSRLPDVSRLRSVLAGDEDALASLPRLYGTREEIAHLASLYEEATVLLGPDASEEEITGLAERDALRKFSVIHLATHALVDDKQPERSALVLSQVGVRDQLKAAMAGDRIYDGLLTTKEILREWNLDADLVTLSGCETGLGKEAAGEGYIGFAHAFLQAGARSLVVSLWNVDDDATSLLMQRFYENRTGAGGKENRGTRHPMTKAEALREAKRWLRSHEDADGRR